MATSIHTITVSRWGSNEREDWDIEYKVRFAFHPGQPGTFYDPGTSDTAEYLSATYEDGKPVEPSDDEWCQEWLEDNQDEAVASARRSRDSAADDHADFKRRQRIDDRLTGADR